MYQSIEEANKKLKTLAQLIEDKPKVIKQSGEIRVGVDLGTANLVLTAVDDSNNPILGFSTPGTVVRDGLVVDYIGAINIIKEMKKKMESVLGREIEIAATAVPPGTGARDIDTFKNVVQSSGFEVSNVVDEPSAAATVLGIKDGIVVDIGGGTTGISILKNGESLYTADEPTGGTHLSLVIAGNYKISFAEAEKMKKDSTQESKIAILITPVIEKIATIINKHISNYDAKTIYLVGGTSNVKGIEKVLAQSTGLEVVKPFHPLLVTPLGIAMNC
ncbi:ethanolamine utilization protein EutJ [Iocasia frigidifontis]|uniref:Chaperone protein DnaK n=1 Tax=Iocasia fonsfrigidae TaxID=2682810 RepID=A0A8A7KL41_9FIRM|nr:ethanolamine utilization protein EutJ [Iocasia fonsfrigidae]QTL98804.1 ethanolamine utilization protein EutJ [Iocasia fonsfrigidae]